MKATRLAITLFLSATASFIVLLPAEADAGGRRLPASQCVTEDADVVLNASGGLNFNGNGGTALCPYDDEADLYHGSVTTLTFGGQDLYNACTVNPCVTYDGSAGGSCGTTGYLASSPSWTTNYSMGSPNVWSSNSSSYAYLSVSCVAFPTGGTLAVFNGYKSN